jgi:hypothetical protein
MVKKLLIVIAIAAVSACGDASSANRQSISFGVADTSSQAASNSAGSAARTDAEPGSESQDISLIQPAIAQAPAVNERKIIRNAELNLEAESPETAQHAITAIAESKGGFVVDSQQSSSDVRTTTRDVVTMTIRVPAERFAEALTEIRGSASRVVVEAIKGQDVTEEFVDIEARLKAKRALEEQFIEIMKRAASVADALNVQRQLGDIRVEIEQIEGRKRFLENQASLSTIKVRLQTPAAFSANSAGFFYRLAESFSTGLDFALNFILVLVTFVIGALPFLLLIGLPVFLGARHILRRQYRRRSVAGIAEVEIQNE